MSQNDLIESRISILGGSGTGKSTLISCLPYTNLLKSGVKIIDNNGPSLSMMLENFAKKSIEADGTISETNINIADAGGPINLLRTYKNAYTVNFDRGTASFEFNELTFRVAINDIPFYRLKIYDYAGGFLDATIEDDTKTSETLSSAIKASDVYMGLLAATDLNQKYIRNDDDSVFIKALSSKTSELSINMFLKVKLTRRESFAYLQCITQIDAPRLNPRMTQNNWNQSLQSLQEILPTLHTCKNHCPFGIVPLSSIGRTEMGGANVNANNELLNSGDSNPDYNPINLDAALLWALYNSLAIHMEQVIDSYASLEEPCFLKKLLSKKAVAQYEKDKNEVLLPLQVYKLLHAQREHLFSAIYGKPEEKFALYKQVNQQLMKEGL